MNPGQAAPRLPGEGATEPPAGTGVVARETLKSAAGLDLLQGMIDGKYPPPPIAGVLDFALTEVAPGRAVFTGRTGARHYNPSGAVHGGIAATLLDSAMGCAVHAMLAAGKGFTTLEIKVNYVRPMFEGVGAIRAEGKIVAFGRTVATAEGKLTDGQGRLIAHGTTTCLIFDL